MKQIEIYVNECIRRLPNKLQKDIQQELMVEITEMVQQKEDEGFEQEKAIQVVLEELGDPVELANQYNDKKSYLIGPNYYSTYVKVLKIVLISVFIGLTIAYVVSTFINVVPNNAGFTPDIIVNPILGYIVRMVDVGLQIFVWVTVIFALIEKNEKSLFDERVKDDKWSIKELPKNIANNKTSKLEGIISIIVYIVFLFIINVRLEVFQIISIGNNKIKLLIPIFNEASKHEWLFWLSIVLVLLITVHLIQLASASLTKKKELFIIGLRFIALGIFIWIVSSLALFNPNLANDIAPNNESFAMWLNQSYLITVGILIFVNAFSIFRKLYKLLKL